MKNQIIPLALITGSIAVQAHAKEPVIKSRPNIIYILADDLGYSELGCYGNKFNETPNLDKLAQQGVRFTQAYAAAPVCSPSRAALMTGEYPARTGITDYLRPNAGQFLDTTYVTLPEALKNNGYHTGIIGKWHLSGYKLDKAPIEVLPGRQGFDEVISSENTGIGDGSYFYPYHFNLSMKKKLNTEHEFIADRMNQEAIEFIEKNQEKPFFLYLSHYVVHTMVHGKPELVDHFRSKPNSGKSSPTDNNPENDPYKKWPKDYFAPKNNPHLAAQLKVIDDGVGMILQKLKDLGIDKNTIIIFTSDNGGESRVTDNAPLRGGKSTLYEGGIREPAIVYQPEKIEGGRVIKDQVVNFDFYPTLCELSGSQLPNKQFIDGKSLVPLLTGAKVKKENPRVFYWHYPLEKRHFLGGRSAGAIREGDWKLIEFFDNGEKELYNLKDDLGETKNLASENPGKVQDLQQKLTLWRKNVINNGFKK
jgi:arylsulfatase A-like enzyme